jgi:transcriptional regulator with XRE-family HTH domain
MRVDRLQQAMDDRGHNQSSLSRAIGVTQGAIQQIMDGTTKRSKYLPDIAEELGVSFRWLTGDSDEREPKGASLPLPSEAQLEVAIQGFANAFFPEVGRLDEVGLQLCAAAWRAFLASYAEDPGRFAEPDRTEFAVGLLSHQFADPQRRAPGRR